MIHCAKLVVPMLRPSTCLTTHIHQPSLTPLSSDSAAKPAARGGRGAAAAAAAEPDGWRGGAVPPSAAAAGERSCGCAPGRSRTRCGPWGMPDVNVHGIACDGGRRAGDAGRAGTAPQRVRCVWVTSDCPLCHTCRQHVRRRKHVRCLLLCHRLVNSMSPHFVSCL